MLLQADAAIIPLKNQSVHCVVTSPPYWGLRKYTGEQGRGEYPNLGLEPTPELHIQHIVEIFREVKRVLRDDGVVWLNYGDCYATHAKGGPDKGTSTIGEKHNVREIGMFEKKGRPEGNLMLMPHRVAIALQDDGWIVRNDLIWFKRNPMPESCAGWRWERKREKISKSNHATEHNIKGGHKKMLEDASVHQGINPEWLAEYEYGEDYELRKGSWRHTRAHEYIFMLTKKMQYWCNQEAVREGISEASLQRINQETFHEQDGGEKDYKHGVNPNRSIRGILENWEQSRTGRNPRTVLDVPTSPYKGAHYATFPPNLIAPLIRASCPRRACPECGQGWAAVVEKKDVIHKREPAHQPGNTPTKVDSTGWEPTIGRTLDYRPTCECGHDEYVPGIVLDPFIGSGTTGAVARELQRRWVGLDISMEYLDQQAKIRALNLTPSNALDELPLFNL